MEILVVFTARKLFVVVFNKQLTFSVYYNIIC